MQALERNQRTNRIVCRQFQSFYLQKEKGPKMQNTTQARDLEKWCTLDCFKQQGHLLMKKMKIRC
jgi:hypothetical protein